MSQPEKRAKIQWAEEWLDSVADGNNTMSQRKLTSIQKKGGIEAIKQVAERKGVHLLQITDDKSNELIAASLNPFNVIC